MSHQITNLFYEAYQLRHVRRTGLTLVGVENPPSVAEHSLIAAQIGYVLARMEGADAHRVAAMLIWHDFAETRIGDLHKISSRYITTKNKAERYAMQDQFREFEFFEDVVSMFVEYEERGSLEGRIAKDADYLEMAFQAKIYVENGHAAAMDIVEAVGRVLTTESAQVIYQNMLTTSSVDWWRETGLKKREGGNG